MTREESTTTADVVAAQVTADVGNTWIGFSRSIHHMSADVDERRNPICGGVDGLEQHMFAEHVNAFTLTEFHHQTEELPIEEGVEERQHVEDGSRSSDR